MIDTTERLSIERMKDAFSRGEEKGRQAEAEAYAALYASQQADLARAEAWKKATEAVEGVAPLALQAVGSYLMRPTEPAPQSGSSST